MVNGRITESARIVFDLAMEKTDELDVFIEKLAHHRNDLILTVQDKIEAFHRENRSSEGWDSAIEDLCSAAVRIQEEMGDLNCNFDGSTYWFTSLYFKSLDGWFNQIYNVLPEDNTQLAAKKGKIAQKWGEAFNPAVLELARHMNDEAKALAMAVPELASRPERPKVFTDVLKEAVYAVGSVSREPTLG